MLLVLVMMGAMALAENDAPIEIATAEQLAAINDNLSGNYVLTADIDLSEYENWQPIGTFQPLSDAPEDAEMPKSMIYSFAAGAPASALLCLLFACMGWLPGDTLKTALIVLFAALALILCGLTIKCRRMTR